MDQDAQNKIFEALGRIETKIDSFEKSMTGPGGRVTELEADMKESNKQRWIHTAVLMPLFGIAHGVATHFGIKI